MCLPVWKAFQFTVANIHEILEPSLETKAHKKAKQNSSSNLSNVNSWFTDGKVQRHLTIDFYGITEQIRTKTWELIEVAPEIYVLIDKDDTEPLYQPSHASHISKN